MTQTYEVREINLSGVVETTIYSGESEADVIRTVRGKGYMPISVKLTASDNLLSKEMKLFQRKVKAKDLSMFCKQLSAMLHAGMPLIDSLEVIKEETTHRRLHVIMIEVIEQIQKGQMFSASLQNYQKDFPPIFYNMVAAGEMTGKLDETLGKLAVHFAKEHKIKQKTQGAMVYPIIIGIVAFAAVIILLNGVVPTFVDIFEQTGVELPKLTQAMLAISGFTTKYWYIVIAAFVLLIISIVQFIKTKQGKSFIDQAAIRIPVVKTATKQIITARFTGTLATLLSSGIPLLDALESAANVTNNTIIIKKIGEVADDIKKGKSLSGLLRKINLFPKMLISMVKVGEESGSIEEMLNRSTEFYEDELDEAIKRLTAVVEPMMILLMAFIIGFVVVSMMLPMFEMFSAIKQ